jgi:hypothetical protein
VGGGEEREREREREREERQRATTRITLAVLKSPISRLPSYRAERDAPRSFPRHFSRSAREAEPSRKVEPEIGTELGQEPGVSWLSVRARVLTCVCTRTRRLSQEFPLNDLSVKSSIDLILFGRAGILSRITVTLAWITLIRNRMLYNVVTRSRDRFYTAKIH